MMERSVAAIRRHGTWCLKLALVVALAVVLLAPHDALAQRGGELPSELIERPAGGEVPGGTLGTDATSDVWRALRQGTPGSTSMRDPRAGQLIQSEGDSWRAIRHGPVSVYGIWAMLGVIGLLALFFLIRGRIRIEHGRSGRTITRFTTVERMGHWLLAVSFIILALTGLNLLYGRYVLPPVIGPEAFGLITYWGKLAHNFVAFAFMAGLALVLVMWAVHNLPNRHDFIWLLKGGGMFSRGSHPPARKFNAGQKILFWLIILGGISISLSGIALMFPFEFALFAKTFQFLNNFGLSLPENLTPIQEMQYNQLWHAIMALFLTAVVIGHIYLGSIGMEGAFDAMGTGQVDVNWAREHHCLWVEVEEARARSGEAEGGGRRAAEPAE
jgi:formate dehydrogenase subunit gamma